MDFCLIKHTFIMHPTICKNMPRRYHLLKRTMPYLKGVGSGIQTSDKRILASNASVAEHRKLHQMDLSSGLLDIQKLTTKKLCSHNM